MTENNQIDINLENKKTDDIYTAIHEILKNAHRIFSHNYSKMILF